MMYHYNFWMRKINPQANDCHRELVDWVSETACNVCNWLNRYKFFNG